MDRKTESHCVVCDGFLIEQISRTEEKMKVTVGYYCADCGIKYARLPKLPESEAVTNGV